MRGGGHRDPEIDAGAYADLAGQPERAARLRGMTLTGYLISTAGEDARRVVEDADIMRLAREDQIRFAEALINPPQPNARLARAAKRHAELIERR